MSHLNKIFTAIKEGHCLPFIGAGASTSFKDKNGNISEGLPSGNDLAKKMTANGKQTKETNYDLLKSAENFLIMNSGNRSVLEKVVQDAIQIGCSPRPVHSVLAQLNQIKIIITSNYDTLLEDELRNYKRNLTIDIYSLQNPRAGHFPGKTQYAEKEIVLHKMHGPI